VKAEDVTIGKRCVFPPERTVWTVVGKRKTKPTKKLPTGGIVFRLAFDDGNVRGQANTHPLDPGAEIQVKED
jgi:hypothetical protein